MCNLSLRNFSLNYCGTFYFMLLYRRTHNFSLSCSWNGSLKIWQLCTYKYLTLNDHEIQFCYQSLTPCYKKLDKSSGSKILSWQCAWDMEFLTLCGYFMRPSKGFQLHNILFKVTQKYFLSLVTQWSSNIASPDWPLVFFQSLEELRALMHHPTILDLSVGPLYIYSFLFFFLHPNRNIPSPRGCESLSN